MDVDIDDEDELTQHVSCLEAENRCLHQQVKQLENALEKEKKFHRKFAEDVIQSEEIRQKDFAKERKDLIEDKKRLLAENRALAKDKLFYQNAFTDLTQTEDAKSSYLPSRTAIPTRSYDTRQSRSKLEPSALSISPFLSPSTSLSTPQTCSKKISKVSEKLFEEIKKMKLKASKLTKDNASLRAKVKQLENFKTKSLNKRSQQEADRNELQNLFKSVSRTNHQIFSPDVLSKLGELSGK